MSVFLEPPTAEASASPRATLRKLVSSNGFAPAVYDLDTRRVVSFRENLYRYPEPGRETRELLFDLYLGLRKAGASLWLTDAALIEAGYEPGTGIVRTVQEDRGLRVTTRYFAPFGLEARAFVVIAEVENVGADTEDVAVFSLHNFHVGGGPNGVLGERIAWDPTLSAYVESSARLDAARGAIVVKPLSPAERGASPENPWPRVASSRRLARVDDSGVVDDAVSGFELDLANRGAFRAGARADVGLVVGYAPDRDSATLVRSIDAWTRGRAPSALLDNERAGWRAWHASDAALKTASAGEARVALQSLAMLRMAQVREPGAPSGGIVASLPPGKWDVAWLRDGMFAVSALARAGHVRESEAGLTFALRGPSGEYERYVGRPYGLSVARYYGNAREESDWNANGPNVELDGFGLFLEAFAATVRLGNDPAFFHAHRAQIDAQVADVLVAYRDAETGLIAGDSSIWESHWDNGGRQRWAFTSGSAVRGLDAWASLIRDLDGAKDPKIAEYRAAADAIHASMLAHLVDERGALAASVEQLRRGTDYADAQAALLLGAPRFDPAGPLGLATLDLIERALFLGSTTGHGYRRNDDGDLYDRREWVVIDLGVSRALRGAGQRARADLRLDWITELGDQNFGVLPELLDENDARYAGEVPMIGFGAGAYILALAERSEGATGEDGGLTDAGLALPDDAGREDTAGETAGREDASVGEPAPSADAGVTDAELPELTRQTEGCGCATAGGAAASSLGPFLLVGAVAALRRSRDPRGA